MPFQRAGIQYGVDVKRFLLGDDMGLEKDYSVYGDYPLSESLAMSSGDTSHTKDQLAA
jgi:hypothetical protein